MFEKKAKEMRERAQMIDAMSRVYENVEGFMKWNAMEYHAPDDEHDNDWFTPHEKDDSWFTEENTLYNACQTVLKMIEKEVDKLSK